MANGMRQILFVLLPAAAAVLVLSEPMIRLVYQRGEFDAGADRRWSPRRSSGSPSRCRPTASTCCRPAPSSASSGPGWRPDRRPVDLVVSALAALVLYKPFGVGGIVAGTGIGTTAAVVAQAVVLRREFGGLELGRLLSTGLRITIASAALAGGLLRRLGRPRPALGRGLVGQIVSLGAGLGAGRARLPRRRQAAPRRRAGADNPPAAPPLDARASARYLLGVAELALLAGFATLGAAASAPGCFRTSPALQLIWQRRSSPSLSSLGR